MTLFTKEIEYYDEKQRCLGYVAYDSNISHQLPAILIAPDWGGRGDAACQKAKELARLGYLGFALDIYGDGKLGKDKVEKRALMTPFRENRELLAQRIFAAYQAVSKIENVNKEKIAAIGYCFGGLCVLDLARMGAPILGAVSYHGLLTPPNELRNNIKAKILILHGFDDPLVPPKEINNFAKEMNQRKADWQVHIYGLTAHSFTDPTANDDEMGLHYRQEADFRSSQSTIDFLKEIFATNNSNSN